MMPVARQLELGHLVCPKTKLPLRDAGGILSAGTDAGAQQYPLRDGLVPILLTDPQWQESYALSSSQMNEEYTPGRLQKSQSLFRKAKAFLTQDYRTVECRQSFDDLFRDLPQEALCVSIGGGPTRSHPRLCNVNIGPFANVDVVADAHCLPYADNCVDVVHCEAVLEHLYDPAGAVREMFRVLKPGGRAYVCTPFLQGYHGYPHHYQNYTLTGQQHLLKTAGFEVQRAGVSVGPVYTLVSFIAGFLNEYAPAPFNLPLRYLWGMAGIFIRPLDLIIARRDNAHVLASTTYALAMKPQA